jgi:hypothetical protein
MLFLRIFKMKHTRQWLEFDSLWNTETKQKMVDHNKIQNQCNPPIPDSITNKKQC